MYSPALQNEIQKLLGGFIECSSFLLQEKQDEPAKIEDSQNLQSPEPLPVKKETPKKYWPCAPDGFIPNSVVRKFVKRHEKSDVEAEEKKDEEGAEDLKTSGETLLMLNLSIAYSLRTFGGSRCGMTY